MPGPRIPNLDQLIAKIPQHVTELPPESGSPIEHYWRGASDAWNLLLYFERNGKRANVYASAFERHVHRLRSMVVLSLVEAFERYTKEVAAVCVDHVAPHLLDDRLAMLRVNARGVAAHFSEKSLGRALCEGDTWLDCKEINDRFGRLLADPFASVSFQLFPQPSAPDGWRRATMDTLFQLRHTIAHNVAVITRSDAARLRVLTKKPVDAPKVLWPNGPDVWYVKVFLDETVNWANERIAKRLAELLSKIHQDDPSIFAPQEKADELSRQFALVLSVAAVMGHPQ